MNPDKKTARIAGLLYLIVAICGGFAYGYVLGKVYAPGDPTATASNVLANADLVRIGVIANLLQATVFVFVGMCFYRLLKHVNIGVASAMVILVAIATAIMCLNDVFQVAALLVATDGSYAAAFGVAGSNALILLLLDMQHYGFLIAQIFFGLWLVPLGYLVFKSEMFPKALGGVLVLGGVCYLIDMLGLFLIPGTGKMFSGFLVIPPTVAEIWMLGYLLVIGVKVPIRGAQAVREGTTSHVLAERS